MLLLSAPYIAFKSNIDFLRTKQTVYPILLWRWSFYVHVFTGVFILLAGLAQFSGYLIRKFKTAHRFLGYIYVTGVLAVTGPAGMVMAFYANGGLAARVSFVLLSFLWILTTTMALKSALQRQFISHGEWMMRSYALTLSALTLRLYTFLIGLFHIDISPLHAYVLVSWLSWTINLFAAEIMIRRGSARTLIKGAY